MRRLTVLCDLDGILVDLLGPWIERCNADFELDPPMSVLDVTGPDLHRYAPVGKDIYKIIDEPGWFRGLPALAGALEAVKELFDDGHEVVVCSAPSLNPESAGDKYYWVQQHMPYLTNENLILTKNKRLCRGDVFIDDDPRNVAKWRMDWPKGVAMQVNWPYNHESPAQVKADSWKDPEAAWERIKKEVQKLAMMQ